MNVSEVEDNDNAGVLLPTKTSKSLCDLGVGPGATLSTFFMSIVQVIMCVTFQGKCEI